MPHKDTVIKNLLELQKRGGAEGWQKLNWDFHIPLEEWDGVRVEMGGDGEEVVNFSLHLSGYHLRGTLDDTSLSLLSELQPKHVFLDDNNFEGDIPMSGLSSLAMDDVRLDTLFIQGNYFVGLIPENLSTKVGSLTYDDFNENTSEARRDLKANRLARVRINKFDRTAYPRLNVHEFSYKYYMPLHRSFYCKGPIDECACQDQSSCKGMACGVDTDCICTACAELSNGPLWRERVPRCSNNHAMYYCTKNNRNCTMCGKSSSKFSQAYHCESCYNQYICLECIPKCIENNNKSFPIKNHRVMTPDDCEGCRFGEEKEEEEITRETDQVKVLQAIWKECPAIARALSQSPNEISVSYANGSKWSLPSAIGYWKSVTRIYINDCVLSGPLPSTLGMMTQLEYLDLNTNDIEGPLPPEIGELHKLNTLVLPQNKKISGTLPREYSKLKELKTLCIWGTSLTGPIPEEYGELAKLECLSLRNQHLTGSIPESFGKLKNLQVLRLSDNDLTGTVPESLLDIPRPQFWELYLHNNKFTGKLPDPLTTLSGLNIDSSGLGRYAPGEWKAKLERKDKKDDSISATSTGTNPTVPPSSKSKPTPTPTPGITPGSGHIGLMDCKCSFDLGLCTFPLENKCTHLNTKCKWTCCNLKWNSPSCC
jgi:hypothetical protein